MTYTGKKRRRRRILPVKDGAFYRQVWRLVDGAVLDCFSHHPNYVEANMARAVRLSIVKRVVGSIMGFVGSSPAGSVSGDASGAETGDAAHSTDRLGGFCNAAIGEGVAKMPSPIYFDAEAARIGIAALDRYRTVLSKPRIRVVAPVERY